MKFITQFERKNKPKYLTNPGIDYHILYSSKYDDNGNIILEEVGKEHIPSMIQSHAESVDINVILERYREGDTQALQRRQGMFGDFTLIPKTYADILNLSMQGQEYFNSLPLEVREQYEHNFAKWLISVQKEASTPKEPLGDTGVEDGKRERASVKGEVEE